MKATYKGETVTCGDVMYQMRLSESFKELNDVEKDNAHLVVYASHLRFIICELLEVNRDGAISVIKNHKTLKPAYKSIYLDVINTNFK